jgi:hypothetical protein
VSATECYFAPPESPFWHWQDDGNVVAWVDGATIAFRSELVPLFQRLRTNCLPPFGAVVLLLAACRDGWTTPPSRVALLHGVLANGKRKDRAELLNRVTAELDRIHCLGEALRTSASAKAELVAIVFEGQGEPASPATFDHLLDELEHGLSETMVRPRRSPTVVDRLLRDLAWLDRGLSRVTAQALATRATTGLEQLPSPVDLELPPIGSARSLLAELKSDPEWSGIVSLAKLLLPVVQLPRQLAAREELPVGGVSDISNRGSLDRLLLSELANDGLTLAVRVAMNEALFLRRETPPRTPTRRRMVVLDSGLRMWGVPRVFATAVGLALAASAEAGTEVAIHRAAGEKLMPVDFSTKAGLVEHMAALDPRVHPGAAVPALAALAEEVSDESDVVLVTGADVLSDPVFQRAIAEAGLAELRLATVARDGSFRLYLQTSRGRKVVREAQFALDDALLPPTLASQRLIASDDASLPALFRAQPFPLRLSVPVDSERSWSVQGVGVLTYTRDGRLLHWDVAALGAWQVTERLVPGELHWAATRAEDGVVWAVVGKLSRTGLAILKINLSDKTSEQTRMDVDIDHPRVVFAHREIVFVADGAQIAAYGLASGQLLATAPLAGLKHVRGRLYVSGPGPYRKFSAASYDGAGIVFTKLFEERPDRPRLATVFEPATHEGPMGLLPSGNLFSFAHNRERRVNFGAIKWNGDVGLDGVSRDGSRLLVSQGGPASSRIVVNVRTVTGVRRREMPQQALEPELFAMAKPVPLRHRFQAVGVDEQGQLTLVGRRDSHWPLAFEQRSQTYTLPKNPIATSLRCRYPFLPLDDPLRRQPYSLGIARWSDGTCAFLDSRGLLHLQSSDDSLPGVTIVLTDGPIAAWSPPDTWWGPRYFRGPAAADQSNAQADFLAPYLERMR